MGVIDFINKPFSEPVLKNRIKTHLEIDEVIRERTALLLKKTQLLESLQNALVYTLADMVESRDKGTGGHIERTTAHTAILIEEMMAGNVYTDELDKMNIDVLVSSARLHDVGKIAIGDALLNNPGKLSDDEFVTMQTHCLSGERIIDNIISRADNVEFLLNAKIIAGSHHERWDGKGYPRGLEGAQIPLQGRIVAVVDVYDALVSDRPYRKALPSLKAVDIIAEGAGSHFDPKITETFIQAKERFEVE
jgi:putative two-component system response regulator